MKNKEKRERIKSRLLELQSKTIDLIESFHFEKFTDSKKLLENEIEKYCKEANVWLPSQFKKEGLKIVLDYETSEDIYPKVFLNRWVFRGQVKNKGINLMNFIQNEIYNITHKNFKN